ncbi:MAG: TetR/AcrR family transcriptional regulator [Solirubrobacterales bacterium]|nr:TetR/AcrR family transcriptional regulator [Solirubrobacterales bacterium]
MARNKQLQDRNEKRDEVVTAASQLLIEDGYDATSMNRIADAAGVTPNTIYWYFKDKDAVLIAVLNAVVDDALAEYQTIAERPISELLPWLLSRLETAKKLVTTVHSRIAQSPELNEWHDRFHVASESLLCSHLERVGVPAEAVDAEAKIGIFAFEGMLMHDLGETQNLAICAALAARWTD